jgi:F-type H+-transporting ATPase subunit a
LVIHKNTFLLTNNNYFSFFLNNYLSGSIKVRNFAKKFLRATELFKVMIGRNILKSIFLAVVSLLISVNSFAEELSVKHELELEKAFDISGMIMHHIKDAHEIHLWGGEHNGTSIYLPIILLDNGMKVFSSKNLYHGELKTTVDHKTGEEVHYVVGAGEASEYAIFHEKIYKLDNGELHIEDGHPHNAKPTSLSITKNVAVLFLVAFILLLVGFSVAKFYKKNGAVAPKGLTKFIEPLVVFVRDDIAKDNIDEHKYMKYTPYLLTIFFFILIANLIGLLPLLGANLSGNITITFFLAMCTLIVTVFSGNKNYWQHIFATPGVPKVLLIIMMPIEIVGIFTKPFALMVRLFANMTAGHIIILAFVGIIFINKSAAWGALSVPMALFISVLEILVAFLQAYLFTILSALFIGMAVEEGHH